MKCQDCHGTGWAATAAGAGVTNFGPCRMCNGSGSASCCEGMVGTAADVPGEIRYLTYGEQQTMRRALQASSRLIAIGAEAPGVVLHLTDEQRDVMRQELYQLAQKLDAQARVATPRSTRQRSLIKRSALIRSVAEQLA
jgi:hypothetical protein